MKREPISLLSATDFNGQPLSWKLLVAGCEQLIADHGYVKLCNVPPSFDPVRLCRHFGRFVPNYVGMLVGDLRPEPGMDDVYASNNTRPLYPHTEGYDFLGAPPRFIALWCITPVTRGEGGETTLADGYAWIDRLDEKGRDVLRRVFKWKTAEGVKRLGVDLETAHPLLEELDRRPVLRFSYNNLLHKPDDPVDRLLESGKAFFEENHVAVGYERGDMLVWDNWRMLHARTAFTDRDRHMRRVQLAANGHAAHHEPSELSVDAQAA